MGRWTGDGQRLEDVFRPAGAASTRKCGGFSRVCRLW